VEWTLLSAAFDLALAFDPDLALDLAFDLTLALDLDLALAPICYPKHQGQELRTGVSAVFGMGSR
jgi:hypothetical protein